MRTPTTKLRTTATTTTTTFLTTTITTTTTLKTTTTLRAITTIVALATTATKNRRTPTAYSHQDPYPTVDKRLVLFTDSYGKRLELEKFCKDPKERSLPACLLNASTNKWSAQPYEEYSHRHKCGTNDIDWVEGDQVANQLVSIFNWIRAVRRLTHRDHWIKSCNRVLLC